MRETVDDHLLLPDDGSGWQRLRRGYRIAGLVTCAHRLGLLRLLADAERTTTSSLADACLADAELVAWLLRGLAGTGFVEEVVADPAAADDPASPAERRWRLSPTGAAIAASPGAATELDALARDYDRFGRLDTTAHALAAGHAPAVTEDEPGGPGAARRAALRDAVRHAGEVDAVLDRLAPQRPLRVLDVGGADGAFSRRLVERWQDARAVVLEQPDMATVAREACAGHPEVDVRAGDYLDGDVLDALPDGADVVVLSHVLQGLGTAAQRRLVCRAASALAPGGCIVSCELVLHADERGPLDTVLWALGEAAAGRPRQVLTDRGQETLLRSAGLAAAGAWTVAGDGHAVLGVRPDAGAEPALALVRPDQGARDQRTQEPLDGEKRAANSSRALRSVS